LRLYDRKEERDKIPVFFFILSIFLFFVLKNPVQLTLWRLFAHNLTQVHSEGIITRDQEIKTGPVEILFCLYSFILCGSLENDPHSPPVGDAAQGEHSLDTLIFRDLVQPYQELSQ
jgi:hypothetical protein